MISVGYKGDLACIYADLKRVHSKLLDKWGDGPEERTLQRIVDRISHNIDMLSDFIVDVETGICDPQEEVLEPTQKLQTLTEYAAGEVL